MILEPHVFVGLLQNFTYLRKLSLASLNISSALPSYLNISYSSLEILNLGDTKLYGKLPGDIFNIQSLEILDLSINSFTLTSQIPSKTSLLPNLVSLDLSNNFDLRFESHILNNILKSSTLLRDLRLSSVNVSGVLRPHLNNRSSSLNYMDLSYCNLMGSLPKSPLNLTHLTYLDLSNNKLNGTLPSWLFTPPSLKYLALEDNMFSGDVSFALPQLEDISIARNQLGDQIDQSLIMKSTNLYSLDLSSNNFNGDWELSTLLSHLTNIEFLYLSYSGLSVTTSNAENISNPNMQFLYLNSCKLKEFPVSLRSMTNLTHLELTNNEMHGDFSFEAREIGDGNKLEFLDLSHNLITSLSQIKLYGLKILNLESNQIQGPFPSSICNMSNLGVLDLSNNRFGGDIPRCSGNINSLEMMDLGNNDFHGTIPNMYENCESLTGLILNGNRLHGELPSSLSKCQSLKILDLGNNSFNGTLPQWLGNLQNLEALILKSNHFHGPIVVGSSFESLRVLDLSHNGFVGRLPQKYFENLKAMMSGLRSTDLEYINFRGVYYSVVMDVKGRDLSFPQLSVDYVILDLSDNRFEGEIPSIIGNLISLIVLDLSHNNLTGRIPLALGNLTNIESVDLSCNRLTGKIPQSLVGITNLEYLNLSKNNLERHIPEGNQFDTFNMSSFQGNPKLCGSPLPNKCSEQSDEPELDDEVDNGFTWRVVMMGYGCGTFVGLLMGYLILSSGRPKWFNAIADAGEYLIHTRRTKRRYVYIGK
ncbi:receptor-like protein 32 [Rutidosis leptorrhynchoides]|uniref:receptor-like protein 32 n=1 Tax=Rutidosis leptorrhynchoides TaxID=125765 RepID=UPI003A9A161A